MDVDVPAPAAKELWRHRLCPSRYYALDKAPGLRRGESFVGEILKGCATRIRLQFRYGRAAATINLGEARARRAMWRTIAADAAEHGRRHLVAYDSPRALSQPFAGHRAVPRVTRHWEKLRALTATATDRLIVGRWRLFGRHC